MCGTQLTPLRTMRGDPFCTEPCRWRHAALAVHQRCVVCDRALAPRDLGVRHCPSVACRTAAEQQRRERVARQRAAVRAAAERLRDRSAAALGVARPEQWPAVPLPQFTQPIANLPERARRALREHLHRVIHEAAVARAAGPLAAAAARSSPADEEQRLAPQHQGVIGHGCALCRGFCCREGGSRAYLTGATITRVMARDPKLRPRDVLALYLGFVGPRTFAGSCVYHGPQGCTLPRELRSDTCNRYLCEAMTAFRRRLRRGAATRAFFAAGKDGELGDAAFCDADRMQRPEPGPEGAAV